MKKTILPIMLSLFFLVTLAAFSGCRSEPSERFDSLQELKDSIDSSLNILFPDTEGYEFKADAMYSKDYPWNANVVMGYRIEGNLNPAESDTNLFVLHFSCRILEAAYNERNPAPPLNANTKVFGTDVNEGIREESGDPNLSALGWYPEGSKIVTYSYQFDIKGCRYFVSGALAIPPEKLNTLDDLQVENIVNNGKKEVLDFVKSIIMHEEK